MSTFDNNICNHCDDLCEFIKHSDQELPNDSNKLLAQVHYKKKETIVKQGSHSSHVIYLKSGLIKVIAERRNDKNVILKIVPPKNFIGLTHMNADTYNFTAVSLRECEVCLWPKESIFNLMRRNNGFAQIIFKAHSKYSDLLVNKISSLGTKQMHGRLADVILYLCDAEFKDTNVFEAITRKDIAEMSGMSSESAIRLLTEFENDGLIKTEGKKLEINNLELLTRLSEVG
jgi:CRP/FNR family transcriptional regulator, polysaccharide utilization system transcription regulator